MFTKEDWAAGGNFSPEKWATFAVRMKGFENHVQRLNEHVFMRQITQ